MRDFLHTLFQWPNGIVVGNLLASAIWGPVGFGLGWFFGRRALKKVHESLGAWFVHLHRRLDLIHPASAVDLPASYGPVREIPFRRYHQVSREKDDE
jgi:hypothetical protein